MFDANLLSTTFGKISGKEIQAFDLNGSSAPGESKVFCFRALHEFTLVEAFKQLLKLTSWAARPNFPLNVDWIGQ